MIQFFIHVNNNSKYIYVYVVGWMAGEHFCSGNGSDTTLLLVHIDEPFASPWCVSVYKAVLVCDNAFFDVKV